MRGVCPECGGESLEYQEIQFLTEENEEMAGFPFTCLDCYYHGVEKYYLVFDEMERW